MAPTESSATPRGAGRPRWHPAFVHFPLACWVLATMLDVAAISAVPIPPEWGIPDLAAVSGLLLWLGLAAAVPAIGFGLVDYAHLPAAARDSSEMLNHVAWMGGAASLFLIAAVLRIDRTDFPSAYVTALEVLGTACLIAGGHFAAIVVFERLPRAVAGARSSDRPFNSEEELTDVDDT